MGVRKLFDKSGNVARKRVVCHNGHNKPVRFSYEGETLEADPGAEFEVDEGYLVDPGRGRRKRVKPCDDQNSPAFGKPAVYNICRHLLVGPAPKAPVAAPEAPPAPPSQSTDQGKGDGANGSQGSSGDDDDTVSDLAKMLVTEKGGDLDALIAEARKRGLSANRRMSADTVARMIVRDDL